MRALLLAGIAAAAGLQAASAQPAPGAVEPILARPLFSPSRRPAAGAPPAPAAIAAAATLPRMAAIVIDGQRRSAIFAGPNGRPLVVSEGGHLGPFTIEQIRPLQVTVTGPKGTRVVHTSFDPNRAAVAPVLPPDMPPPVALLDPARFPLPARAPQR